MTDAEGVCSKIHGNAPALGHFGRSEKCPGQRKSVAFTTISPGVIVPTLQRPHSDKGCIWAVGRVSEPHE